MKRLAAGPLGSVLAWALVLPWALWALVRLSGIEIRYPAPQLLAMTPFASVAAVLAFAVVAVVLRRRWPAVVGLASAAVLVAFVAPRALGDEEVRQERPLRVLSVNIFGERGDTENVVRLVRRTDADVLSVQELQPRALELLDAAGLRRLLPHRVARPLPGAAGNGLFARFPLEELEPPPGQHAMITARGTYRGMTFDVTAVHPRAPISETSTPGWRRQLKRLPKATKDGPPRILAGDFNASLDHPEFRDLVGTGYEDAAEQTGKGLTPTWPKFKRYPAWVQIDHVLADERASFGRVSFHTVPRSDHRAVFAEIYLPRR